MRINRERRPSTILESPYDAALCLPFTHLRSDVRVATALTAGDDEGLRGRIRSCGASVSSFTVIDWRLHPRYCRHDHAGFEDDCYQSRIRPRDNGHRRAFDSKPVLRLETAGVMKTSSPSQ